MTTNHSEPRRDEAASLNGLFRETYDMVDKVVADTTDAEIDERLRIILSRAGYTDVGSFGANRVGAGDGGVAELTLDEVAALAIRAHDGQYEMFGGPYHGHLRVVAEALTPFGPEMVMAGWLHDILEMTDWTADQLRGAGVPTRVVDIVQRVTPDPDTDYLDSIRLIAQDPEAILVKIADNADSIYPDRTPVIPNSAEQIAEYEQARQILWSATSREIIAMIVGRVNPPLLLR